ncbi:hypothetical protein AB0M20_05475 [Actinoplanes sp. NPDC051633]|uniref:hypothetical protein n=1 Tax=Actinoplanes sp. NPDC051633 TaxID=3155670 RepID=UPI003438F5B5
MSADQPFAGDVFLDLARDGRLTIEAAEAERLAGSLELTLAAVLERLRVVERWRQLDAPTLDGLPGPAAQVVADAIFQDQTVPGRLEQAADELPKYIAALRAAGRR